MENQEEESFERALADVEIVSSAYPDEITSECSQDKFPLYFTIHLNKESNATISLEILPGYPTESGIQVATYRSKPHEKQRMEATILAVRREAKLCQQNSVEGGFSCCSAAFDTWNSFEEAIEQCSDERTVQAEPENQAIYDWVSGPPMVEKKSTFQGHLCRVENESQVQEALHQLISSSSKLQRASHNMYAWRIKETTDDGRVIYKHDNDDDGEDAAGSKLAYLLDMRKDENVVVVVSRWYGGIHLGPKRFQVITNVAREMLVDYFGDNN